MLRKCFPCVQQNFEACKNWIFEVFALRNGVSCRARRGLSNEPLVAKIGFDTAENEPMFSKKGHFCSGVFFLLERHWSAAEIDRLLPLAFGERGGVVGAREVGVEEPVTHRALLRRWTALVHVAPELKGSIGEGSNHSNFSHQSSVKSLSF